MKIFSQAENENVKPDMSFIPLYIENSNNETRKESLKNCVYKK